jgi:rRNA-processing protein FCF1
MRDHPLNDSADLVVRQISAFNFEDFETENNHSINGFFQVENNVKNIIDEDIDLQSTNDLDYIKRETNVNRINTDDFISTLMDNEDDGAIQELKSKTEILKETLKSENERKRLVEGQTVLIFDTNCYLADFKTIKSLMESQKYPIIIPLTVINELDGISVNKNAIAASAARAISFIESNIKSRIFSIQSLSGKILGSLVFRTENWNGFHNADDVILSACRNHQNPCLITDDINLRLKARAFGIYVLSLPEIRKILKSDLT